MQLWSFKDNHAVPKCRIVFSVSVLDHSHLSSLLSFTS